jgi:hypothetical protein
LVGPIKTRSEIRLRYDLVVADLKAADSKLALLSALEAHSSTITQIHSEAPLLWRGDAAEFRGLEKEIEHATARVDDGLDFPRWEHSGHQISNPLL